MYTIKHLQLNVKDTIDNFEKILDHPNIIVKKFQRQRFWTNRLTKEYKYDNIMTAASIDCYLKVKHSRRLKEITQSWIISAKDVLLVVK